MRKSERRSFCSEWEQHHDCNACAQEKDLLQRVPEEETIESEWARNQSQSALSTRTQEFSVLCTLLLQNCHATGLLSEWGCAQGQKDHLQERYSQHFLLCGRERTEEPLQWESGLDTGSGKDVVIVLWKIGTIDESWRFITKCNCSKDYISGKQMLGRINKSSEQSTMGRIKNP